jgi:ABC-type uncharacterized transport system ATPase subunit
VTVISEQGRPVPQSGDEPIFRVSDITVRFGGIQALSQLSFDATKSEVLGIIGPNGAGTRPPANPTDAE